VCVLFDAHPIKNPSNFLVVEVSEEIFVAEISADPVYDLVA